MNKLIGIWITAGCLLGNQDLPAEEAPAVQSAARVPEYICPRATAPIAIDGMLNEPAWQSAPVISGFLTLGPQGDPAKNVSKVQWLYDAKYLYIGADLTTQPGKMPDTLPDTKRDFNVCNNDDIDIFLAPREGGAVTYQFVVSANGYLHDLKHELKNTDPDSWNSQAEIKTQQRLGGWSVEIAIPFADLGRSAFRGDVWVFRIGVVANGFPYAMWPHNRELAFNNKACKAYLIFEDRNLVVNGDFEAAAPNTNAPPPGWRYAVNTDPKVEGQGTIRIMTMPDAPQGPHVMEIDKTDELGHFPALLFENMPLEPGATYEFSAWVKSEQPFHAGVSFLGPETEVAAQRVCVQGERPYPAAPAFTRIKAQYRTDKNVVRGDIIFRYQKQRGKLWVDDVTFQRINGLAAAGRKSKTADPIHNLVELSRRTAFKPYWLLKKPDGWYRNARTVFKDTGTGATIWKMSRYPGQQCRQVYMEFPPWNCNGDRLGLYALPDWWHIDMQPDGSAWKPVEGVYQYFWDRFDPDILWYSDAGSDKLLKQNMVTGEIMFSKTFAGRISLWPMSRDGKYILINENIKEGDQIRSRVHLVPSDMSTGSSIIMIGPLDHVHAVWFTNRRDYSVALTWEDYVRGGRIMTPDGKVVKDVKYGIPVPGNHNAPGPSGKWFIAAEGYIRDALTGETMWITDHSMGHQSWGPDGDAWFMGSSGYDIRRFGVPPKHFDQLLGSANSKMKYSEYCCEEHPVMSPDGTKAGYASNMLGYSEFYNLIMRLPEPPFNLTIRAIGDAMRLEWQAAKHVRETAFYHIYRSKFMTGPYEYVATVPGAKTSYDNAGNSKGYFVVTAQEYSGLESYYSNPATIDRRKIPFKIPSGGVLSKLMAALGWGEEPFIVPAEAESGEYENPGEEIFDSNAANLYAVALGIEKPCAGLTLKANMPWKIEGMVFGRFQNTRDDLEPSLQVYINNNKAGAVKLKAKQWHWINLTGEKKIGFKAGVAEIRLVPSESGIVVDQVLIVNSVEAVPKLFWGRDHVPPNPVREVTAEAVDSYNVRLKWKAPKTSPDTAYYNIYAARGSNCAPANETLISSPTEPEALDWGLMADTSYAYRITAVDRAGNESQPSETKVVSTPAVPDRVFIQQACALRTTGTNRLDVPFKLDKDQNIYLWVKMRCFNQNNNVRFNVYVDAKELREPYLFPVHFITPHHPGPVSGVWFWSRIVNSFKNSDEGRNFLMPVKAGQHVLSLVPDARSGIIDVETGEIVITNDKGYVPPGIVNYLIDPDRGRKYPGNESGNN